MLTDRGKGTLAVAVGAWLASRILGVAELSMAALAMVALVALAAGYTATTSARLTARRRVHPPRLFFDAEGSVELTIVNTGRLPTAILQVTDDVPVGVADDARFVLAPLAQGGAATLHYQLRGRHRGRYELGPLTVRLRDPFGLTARRHRFGATDEVVVYPPVWRLPAGVPLSGHTTSAGAGRPRPLPSGEELANVREYVRGDDLRKVHWRTTAHRGTLMVRQEESPQNPEAVVVLDVRAGLHRGGGPTASLETAIAAAASATLHLTERSYAVKLLDRPVAATPRALPWELVLEQLAIATAERDIDLGGLWQQLGQGVAGEGVVCAVVTVPSPTEMRAMVRGGRGFSSRLAVLVEVGGRRDGSSTDATADALRAAGWRVTVLRGGQRIDEAWRELALARRARAVTAVGTPGGVR